MYKGVPFHPSEVCPYCKARVWSMLQAKIIPQSACVRLEAYEDCIEYFVCLNGHLIGICTLAPLSVSEDEIPSVESNLIEKKQDNGIAKENVLKRNILCWVELKMELSLKND
ncbi:unnamed protein product [Brassica napus]|uniref:(rape) hypothetical protein n=1 Tax=Brassica napus TaxID=3708 RepID=A0A816WPJ6_BRANA|nr:unnamed protein product [Brassica napus]